jgi:hypothetical protein
VGDNRHRGSLPEAVFLAQDGDGGVNIKYSHKKIVPERKSTRKTGFTFQLYGAIIHT